jgi:hypothetical protein
MIVKWETPENPPISLYEAFAPPLLDRTVISWLLAGQGFLLSVALTLGSLFNMDVIHYATLSFDLETIKTALIFAAIMTSEYRTW